MIDIDGKPAVVGDIICSVSYQEYLGCIGSWYGRNLWFQDSSSHHSQPTVIACNFVSEAGGTVRAFQAGSGQVVDNEQLYLRGLTGPALFDNTLAVADAGGLFALLNAQMVALWAAPKSMAVVSAPPFSGGGEQLIVQANNGSVSAPYKIR